MVTEGMTPEEIKAREEKMARWHEREEATQAEIRHQVDVIMPYLVDKIKMNANVRDEDVSREAPPEASAALEAFAIPEKGRSTEEVFDFLVNTVFQYGMQIQHPRFLSYVTSTVSPYALGAAILSDVYNFNGASWNFAPLCIEAENQVLAWMCEKAGFPAETCGGVFVSGGSMANFTGQIAARDNKLKPEEWGKGVAYFSDQTHASTEKGLHMIGLRPDQIVKIPTDDEFKIQIPLLRQAIERDVAAGKKPFLIIGNIGSTNTGSIDPLEEMADIAEEFNMWFHIDGAYGGSILASKKYASLAKGVERVDSMAWDGHKWLMQPYSCSATIVRNKQLLVNAFITHPEYLANVVSDNHTNPWDLGPEMSRPVRGLKLWATLQGVGTDEVSTLVGKAWHMTKAAKEEFDVRQGWEILAPPCCGTIAFRYVPEGWTDLDKINELNQRISDRTISENYVFVASTVLKGKTAMRLNMINFETTDEDVRNAVAYLDHCARVEMSLE